MTAGELYGGQRRCILECLDRLTKVLKYRLVNNLLGVTDCAILFYSNTFSVQRTLNHHVADVHILFLCVCVCVGGGLCVCVCVGVCLCVYVLYAV